MDRLADRLAAATGTDAAVDAAVADVFPEAANLARVSGSVDACLALIRQALPEWRWHLGYGASGVLPYAALTKGHERVAAEAPTVPIALLRAALAAKRMDA